MIQTTNINYLPQPQIIKELFEKFCTNAESSATSSHWKLYLNKTSVELSPDGALHGLEGSGFGDYASPKLIDTGLSALTVLSYLSVLQNKKEILKQLSNVSSFGVPLSFDGFKQAAIVTLLKRQFSSQKSTPRKICIIGDGFGVLSALLKKNFPETNITLIDLGKVLIFQNLFLQSRYERSSFQILSSTNSKATADFNFAPAEHIKNIDFEKDQFDLVINVASMQEMSLDWIAFYFEFIRKTIKPDGLFYCCNREKKKLPGGETPEFLKYPWKKDDVFLLDEIAPFYRWFFQRERTENNFKLLNVKIPLMRLFDGTTRHRLARMTKNPQP